MPNIIPHLREFAKIVTNYRGERIRAVRREIFELVRHFSPSIAVDFGGTWYFVGTADRGLSRRVFIEGSYDKDVMAATIALLDRTLGEPVLSNKTFIDIGANIGTAAIPAVLEFGASSAICFEPEPQNYRLLRCNLISNDLETRITTIPFGLSDSHKTAHLEQDQESWGDHRVRSETRRVDGPYCESQRTVISIELVTFDEMVSDLPIDMSRVGIVWIDVQGHEAAVLAGATTLLKSAIPVVIEYWPYGLRRADSLDLFHELVTKNYSTIIDMRQTITSGRTASQPASEIYSLAGRYTKQAYTDLVLLR
jgi:FkbM family methyltransferase